MSEVLDGIDSLARVHPDAKLAEDVKVGPWTIIEAGVEIAAGSEIASHVIIKSGTTLGKNNKIYQFCTIGDDPQSTNYDGSPTQLILGDNNIIREYCSLHRGTQFGGGVTRIGNDNMLMAYSHVGHDSQVGNHIIFANAATLAGHAEIGDYVMLSGFAAVHQFLRVGAYSFVGRSGKVFQDILPYVMAEGNSARPRGLNLVGLRRHGFSSEQRALIKQAYRIIYCEGLNIAAALEKLHELNDPTHVVQPMIDMVKTSTRGIARPK